jgi:hypothetical protein
MAGRLSSEVSGKQNTEIRGGQINASDEATR